MAVLCNREKSKLLSALLPQVSDMFFFMLNKS